MKIKYLILGKGFIGTKFSEFLENSVLSGKRINSVQDVESEIEKYNPEWVINCIGKTGKPNVDWCEAHKNETMFSNILVPIMILQACEETGKRMVHIGTGCIYEGNNQGKGFSEEDEPNFSGSYYSRTKMAIEKILKEFNVLQIRIRMPINGETNERNLITKLLRYDKIINVPNSLTYVDDLMVAGEKLMQLNATGIFNVVNPQPATHKQILDSHNLVSPAKKEYSLITLSELDKMTAARRSNCVLSTKKLNSLGIHLTPTQEAIKKSVAGYVEAENGK